MCDWPQTAISAALALMRIDDMVGGMDLQCSPERPVLWEGRVYVDRS